MRKTIFYCVLASLWISLPTNACRIFPAKSTTPARAKNLTTAQVGTYAQALRDNGSIVIPSAHSPLPRDLGEKIWKNIILMDVDPEAPIMINELRARIPFDHSLTPIWDRNRVDLFIGMRKPAGFLEDISFLELMPAVHLVSKILNQSVPESEKGKGVWAPSFRQTALVLEHLPGRTKSWVFPKRKKGISDRRGRLGAHIDELTHRRVLYYLKGPGGYFNTSGKPIPGFRWKTFFSRSWFEQAEEFGIAILSGEQGAERWDVHPTEHVDADYSRPRAFFRQDWQWVSTL